VLKSIAGCLQERAACSRSFLWGSCSRFELWTQAGVLLPAQLLLQLQGCRLLQLTPRMTAGCSIMMATAVGSVWALAAVQDLDNACLHSKVVGPSSCIA
jgi:hypothetical protein